VPNEHRQAPQRQRVLGLFMNTAGIAHGAWQHTAQPGVGNAGLPVREVIGQLNRADMIGRLR
jgi:hypothetical protein